MKSFWNYIPLLFIALHFPAFAQADSPGPGDPETKSSIESATQGLAHQRRIPPLRIFGSFNFLDQRPHTGQDSGLSLSYRYHERNEVSLSYENARRTYAGSGELRDEQITLSHTLVHGSFYLEKILQYSFRALIYSRYAIGLVPHYAIFASDLSVGLFFSDYQVGPSVFTVAPQWIYDWDDDTQVGVAMNVSIVSRVLASGRFYTEYRFLPYFSGRIDFAFGDAVEAANLIGNFHSTNLSLRYQISPAVTLIPNAGFYRGSLRTENAYGFGAEFLL